MTSEVPVQRLIDLVCAETDDWPAASRCCQALRACEQPTLVSREIAAQDLKRIYERRLASNPDVVEGGRRLLEDLEGYSADVLVMTSLESQGSVFCLMLDAALQCLVGCFVARDRRFIAGDSATEER